MGVRGGGGDIGEEVSSEPLVCKLEVVEGGRDEVETAGGVEVLEAKQVLRGGGEGGRGGGGGGGGGKQGQRGVCV